MSDPKGFDPAPRPSPLSPRQTRRATTMDRVRVRALAERLSAGEDEVEAFWTVVSDPRMGFARYRGKRRRPQELKLRRQLAALLERTVPHVIALARDAALARMAGLSDEAVRALEEVVSGNIESPETARYRIDAARIILGSLGIKDQGASASASASVQILSLGEGLRALRRDSGAQDAGGEVRDVAR